MGLNEQVETAVRGWFSSEKGKTATRIAIAMAAGEVVGYIASSNLVAVGLIVLNFSYVAVWVANKYANFKKPPSVQGGGNE